jgi:hypothetical protein
MTENGTDSIQRSPRGENSKQRCEKTHKREIGYLGNPRFTQSQDPKQREETVDHDAGDESLEQRKWEE